jgi:hypothetical protein
MTVLSYGQHIIKGRVVDAISLEPVQGANITFNGSNTLVATSSADGRFELQSDVPLVSLDCKFAGYKSFSMKLKKRKTAILIELVPIDDESKETDTIKSPAELPRKGN